VALASLSLSSGTESWVHCARLPRIPPLTTNFLTTSLPQAQSWAEGKDESLYSLTQYLDVLGAAQHQPFSQLS